MRVKKAQYAYYPFLLFIISQRFENCNTILRKISLRRVLLCDEKTHFCVDNDKNMRYTVITKTQIRI